MTALAATTMDVTYAEIRWWARWLDTFTPSDLADAMGVDRSWGERGVRALLWHGICEETGDHLDGSDGPEPVIAYKPLPAGPREHETGTLPEVIAVMEMGGFLLYDPRGLPVRLIDNTQRRNLMQGTGGARLRVKLRDQRYEAMQRAKMERAEKQRQKAKAAAANGKHSKAAPPANPNKRQAVNGSTPDGAAVRKPNRKAGRKTK